MRFELILCWLKVSSSIQLNYTGIWQGILESNQLIEGQNLMRYHYANPLYIWCKTNPTSDPTSEKQRPWPPKTFTEIPVKEQPQTRQTWTCLIGQWRNHSDSNWNTFSGYWRFSKPFPYQIRVMAPCRPFNSDAMAYVRLFWEWRTFSAWSTRRDSNPQHHAWRAYDLPLNYWCIWSEWRDSNPRPREPRSRALPTGLHPDFLFHHFLYL